MDEAKADETLRIELSDELEQLKLDQKNLVVIFAARGPEEGATPMAQVRCSRRTQKVGWRGGWDAGRGAEGVEGCRTRPFVDVGFVYVG